MSYADGSSFLSLSAPRPAASSLSEVSRISLTGRPFVPMTHFSICPTNATTTAIHEQKTVLARRACVPRGFTAGVVGKGGRVEGRAGRDRQTAEV